MLPMRLRQWKVRLTGVQTPVGTSHKPVSDLCLHENKVVGTCAVPLRLQCALKSPRSLVKRHILIL